MSNVSIKAEIIQSANILVSLYFCHDYVCILLVCPLLAKQLIQVDSLEGAYPRRIFNKFI